MLAAVIGFINLPFTNFEFLTDWSELPAWPQMLRRALLFRLAITLAHPLTPPDELVTVLSTAERIEPYLN